MVSTIMSVEATPLPNDPAVLKAMIAALQAENQKMSASLRAHDLLVQALRVRIARLQKQKFGSSSEKIEREIEQLELALEDLQVALAEADELPPEGDDEPETDNQTPEPAEPRESRRRRPKVSQDTPRERRELDPGDSCPDCGGDLRVVGEDVSELIDMIAAQLKVIEIARIKKSCRRCERMVQSPAPSRPIPRSMAGPNLLAYVLTSKFDDHVPLYRQNEIFARMGADIPDTTLAGWCGGAMKTLAPLIEKIEAEIMASNLLHADDTPIRVLDRGRRDKGLGRASRKAGSGPMSGISAHGRARPRPVRSITLPRTGRKSMSSPILARPAAFSRLMATRGMPSSMPRTWTARASSGRPRAGRIFAAAFTMSGPRRNPQSRARRSTVSASSTTSNGKSAASLPNCGWPCAKKESKPKVDAFRDWVERQLTRIPGKSDLAKAFRYGLSRWASFTLFLEDGRVAIDNNPAERALRPIGVGRRNWLFAGSDTGGETLARAMTVIETAKMNGLDPQAYLADVLDRIHDHMVNRLAELLPWNWKPADQKRSEAA